MQGRKFELLDAMRGVAAIAVFIGHTPSPAFAHLLPKAYLAVDLFFCLSGFVLMHAYGERLSRGMTWLEFAKLRLIRLYPLVLLGLTLGLIFAVTVSGRPVDAALGLAAVENFLFLPAFGAGVMDFAPYDGGVGRSSFPFDMPLWSLFFEMAVSLLFGVLAPRLSPRVLACIIGGSLLALIASALQFHSLDGGVTVGTLHAGAARAGFSFFTGCAVYRLWRTGRLSRFRAPGWVLLVFLASLFLITPPHNGPYDLFVAVVVFPPLILVAANAKPGPLDPLWTRLGLASFALYALHYPMMLWIDYGLSSLFGTRLQALGPVGTGLLIVAGIALALAADKFYDRPVRARLLRRKPAIAEVAR
jgi:peptidoglycan/LPS O-acetylase OafA/YrhL